MSEQNNRFALLQIEAYEKIVASGQHELLGTFCALLMHTFGKGECYPSIDTLASMTKLSERTISRQTRLLEALGLLEIIPTFHEDGRQTSNRYKIASFQLYKTTDDRDGDDTGDAHVDVIRAAPYIKGLKKTSNKNISLDDLKSLLDRIRTEYPKRLGGSGWTPKTADKIRTIPENEWEQVVRGVIGYRCEMEKAENIGTSYVKQMSTFFNQECWREFSSKEFLNLKIPEPVEGVDYRVIEEGIGLYRVEMNSDDKFNLKAWQNKKRVELGMDPKP